MDERHSTEPRRPRDKGDLRACAKGKTSRAKGDEGPTDFILLYCYRISVYILFDL